MRSRPIFVPFFGLATVAMMVSGWHLQRYMVASHRWEPTDEPFFYVTASALFSIAFAWCSCRAIRMIALTSKLNVSEPNLMIKRYLSSLAVIWVSLVPSLAAGSSFATAHRFRWMELSRPELASSLSGALIFAGVVGWLGFLLVRELSRWHSWSE